MTFRSLAPKANDEMKIKNQKKVANIYQTLDLFLETMILYKFVIRSHIHRNVSNQKNIAANVCKSALVVDMSIHRLAS
jgi:hypothetical protein